MSEFIKITEDNIEKEHLCCIIREKKRMLGAKKQKAWFSDQSFAEKFGFAEIDSTPDGYKLFALSFDKNAEKSALPSFTPGARLGKIENKEPTIFYTPQCPYTYQAIENAKKACEKLHLPLIINEVKTSEEAKDLPCAFNNFALFFNGIFQTPNLPDEKTLLKIFSASTK